MADIATPVDQLARSLAPSPKTAKLNDIQSNEHQRGGRPDKLEKKQTTRGRSRNPEVQYTHSNQVGTTTPSSTPPGGLTGPITSPSLAQKKGSSLPSIPSLPFRPSATANAVMSSPGMHASSRAVSDERTPSTPDGLLTRNLSASAPSSVGPRAQLRQRPNSYSEDHQPAGHNGIVDGTRVVSLDLAKRSGVEDPSRTRVEQRSSSQGNIGRKRTVRRHEAFRIGTTIDKNHKNYILMYNMLTGIRIGVSRCQAKPRRPLTEMDFRAAHKLAFDITGNELTPTSDYDFKFKDYAPWAFRYLREYFKVRTTDYLQSLTGKYVLSEIGSPGKSGSFFYFSHDYRFIIKTIHHSEQKLLLKVLPKYLSHVSNNPNTLLSRFFGLHRVKEPGGKKIHFVVMSNIFPPHKDIHETFDLKGSTVGRAVSEEEMKNNPRSVLKDLNWSTRGRRLELGPQKRRIFFQQLESDVEILTELNIMDYSLLIGIHNLKRGNSDGIRDTMLSMFEPNKSMERAQSQRRRQLQDKNAAMKQVLTHSDPVDIAPNALPDGSFIERQNCCFYADDGGFRSTDENDEPNEEVYYVGVIDILTPYNYTKRFEHALKSVGQSRKAISAVAPGAYGRRFLKFMKNITKYTGPQPRSHMNGNLEGSV